MTLSVVDIGFGVLNEGAALVWKLLFLLQREKKNGHMEQRLQASAQKRYMLCLFTFYWPKQIMGQADINGARKSTSSKGKSCKSYGHGENRESSYGKGSE